MTSAGIAIVVATPRGGTGGCSAGAGAVRRAGALLTCWELAGIGCAWVAVTGALRGSARSEAGDGGSSLAANTSAISGVISSRAGLRLDKCLLLLGWHDQAHLRADILPKLPDFPGRRTVGFKLLHGPAVIESLLEDYAIADD